MIDMDTAVAKVADALSGARLVPDATVAEICSYGFDERGKVFVLTVSTTAGDTVVIQAAPGEPISIALLTDSRAQ